MRAKKPAELTKEQWNNYKESHKLSLHAMDKALDLIADMNFQAGEIVERERIIKLLEPLAKHDELCKGGCYPEDCSAHSYQYAIELIKGEQK